jgi:hypothetical protein
LAAYATIHGANDAVSVCGRAAVSQILSVDGRIFEEMDGVEEATMVMLPAVYNICCY